MRKVRHPAVAGTFYPARANDLKKAVAAYLNAAEGNGIAPKAIITPHAGYIYSGPVAGSVYKWLVTSKAGKTVTRVILLGPSHFIPCRGLAASSAEAFVTPLGQVPIDREAITQLETLPQVSILDAAHAREHSLEVQLPFLQSVLGEFSLLPLVVGNASPAEVAEVMTMVWGGPETLVVISSDLSHFHNYEMAQKLDRATADAIESLRPENIEHNRACGRVAIQGLLLLAQKRNLSVKRVDLRNSGDTAGSRDQVVGYGAWVFT